MKIVLMLVLLVALTEGIYGYYRAKSAHSGMLPPNDRVLIAGESMEVQDAAMRYAPRIIHDPELVYPPHKIHYYCKKVDRDRVVLAYRVMRANERHPHSFVHYLYSVYRMFYYGSVKDIEYIELEVSLADGLVRRILYEEGIRRNTSVEHVPIELVLTEGGGYETTNYHGDGQRSGTQSVKNSYAELSFRVAHWNGLFEVVQEEDLSRHPGWVAPKLPLQAATIGYTLRYRMWRRSFGLVFA